VRARYVIPYEDHLFGGGTLALDAAIDRVERHADGWKIFATGTTVPGAFTFDADEVIAATGFTVPLGDLRALGLKTFSNDRIPALTPFWESATVPGLYFGGTLSMGAVGLRKYGLGSLSAGVAGFRHNMRVLAQHLAQTYFGVTVPRRDLRPDEVVPFLLGEANTAPELWNQQAYLAHAVSFAPDGRIRDEGVVPLQHFVDSAAPDAAAIAVETDDKGEHRPVVYVRQRGTISETILPPEPLLNFATPEHHARLSDVLRSTLQR